MIHSNRHSDRVKEGKRITEATDKPAGGSSGSGGAEKGSGGAMSAATVRRPSGNIATGHGHGIGNRPTYIMTSAHSRRVSASNVAASAVSRAYENTYKTEPEKNFCPAAAKQVIREVMEGMLEGKSYSDIMQSQQLTTLMADAIKKGVKEMGFQRYKLVTHVAIGQTHDASVAFASRCVWNPSFDSFAEYTYKSGCLFAVGLVYAIYID
ncbi:hypothetical protein ACOMHN_003072 [Nucella lapillus]